MHYIMLVLRPFLRMLHFVMYLRYARLPAREKKLWCGTLFMNKERSIIS